MVPGKLSGPPGVHVGPSDPGDADIGRSDFFDASAPGGRGNFPRTVFFRPESSFDGLGAQKWLPEAAQHVGSDLGGIAMAACKRPNCLFTRLPSAGRRHHGYCCNACRWGEEGHTSHCTGYRHQSLMSREEPEPEKAALQPTQTDGAAFRIPDTWGCAPGRIVEYIDWLTWNLLGNRLDVDTRNAWRKLDDKMAFIERGRQLTIHVLAEHPASPLLTNTDACAFIDVNEEGVHAHVPQPYDQGQVTGIDCVVQAVLSSQRVTAEVLWDACKLIEMQELDTFAFRCAHATHRSCGCAVLLANLVYPSARIVFSTNRTIRAARDHRMIEVQN